MEARSLGGHFIIALMKESAMMIYGVETEEVVDKGYRQSFAQTSCHLKDRIFGRTALNFIDMVGLTAGGMVLATFAMRSMLLLRLTAILSNIAFMAYGILMELLPIWLLHAILLPLNGWRAKEEIAARRDAAKGEVQAQDFGSR